MKYKYLFTCNPEQYSRERDRENIAEGWEPELEFYPTALPIGDNTPIRGLRYKDIIYDDVEDLTSQLKSAFKRERNE